MISIVIRTFHRQRHWAAGLAILAAAAMAPQPAAAGDCVAADDFDGIRLPATCLSPEEGQIVRMRVFRAELAVAALSCNQQSQYNAFVTRHQDELVRKGRALRRLFARLHPRNTEDKLNRFITHLANRASLKRLAVTGYCDTMDRVFREARSQPRQGLAAYVRQRSVDSTTTEAVKDDGAQKVAAQRIAADGDSQVLDK